VLTTLSGNDVSWYSQKNKEAGLTFKIKNKIICEQFKLISDSRGEIFMKRGVSLFVLFVCLLSVISYAKTGGGYYIFTKKGDTLWKIANKHYGFASNTIYQAIKAANEDVIKSINYIKPGIKIYLPTKEEINKFSLLLMEEKKRKSAPKSTSKIMKKGISTSKSVVLSSKKVADEDVIKKVIITKKHIKKHVGRKTNTSIVKLPKVSVSGYHHAVRIVLPKKSVSGR
jgi:phage tail protein X